MLPAAAGKVGTRPRHRASRPGEPPSPNGHAATGPLVLDPDAAPGPAPATAPTDLPGKRRAWISRAALLTILCLQAVLSLRMHNTAFEDEALYLYSGRIELSHLVYGTPLYGGFPSYFSGAPVLYPVLAALGDAAGGLAAARAVSLLAMLITTTLLYSLTRRLFNERVGLCAALVFAVTESTLFIGHLATYDAPALGLLAFASWIVVRTATFRWPVFLLAAPVAALAVATKYAALLFVPTIVLLPALAGWPYRGRRVLAYPLYLAVAIGALLAAALRLAGPAYLQGVEFTTLSRATGFSPTTMLLRDCVTWGAVALALAMTGSIAYAIRPRTEAGEQIAPPGGRWRRAALGAVLTGTALLAPAEQIRLQTETSLAKHIGFGLFFAAPMAGVGLARIIGGHFRRAQVGVAVWGVALAVGMVQASSQYGWPSSATFVRAFSGYLRPGAHYLVEVPEVPMYYLMARRDGQPYQFTSTYVITYTDARGRTLTGDSGYTAAIRDGYFQVVAYNGLTTPATDAVIARALEASSTYRLARVVFSDSSYGRIPYYIWVRR
jgi:Dolichyl-phosphate-mannose-protein mannosyltransferase